MLPTRLGKKKRRLDAQVFTLEENPCVWMEAGVVNFKLCGHEYDCPNCAFDRAMSMAWDQDGMPGNNGRERD